MNRFQYFYRHFVQIFMKITTCLFTHEWIFHVRTQNIGVLISNFKTPCVVIRQFDLIPMYVITKAHLFPIFCYYIFVDCTQFKVKFYKSSFFSICTSMSVGICSAIHYWLIWVQVRLRSPNGPEMVYLQPTKWKVGRVHYIELVSYQGGSVMMWAGISN